MLHKPDFLPALSEHLKANGIDVGNLMLSIKSYMMENQAPDHYEQPFDFIESMSYFEAVEPFLTLLENESE
jgi:hypothetical protein